MADPPSRRSGPDTGTPSPILGRRERKKREAHRKIFQAAFDLFREKGFDGTTVGEIAERADVGKGTVFNYFPRKASFLDAWVQHWSDSLTEEMGPVGQWEGTTRQKMERLFRFLADLGGEDPDLARQALFESLRHMQQVTGIEDERGVREIRGAIRSVLDAGRASGEIRQDLETEDAATLIESTFHRTLIFWLRAGGSTESLHREISAKLDIIFDGLVPRAGARRPGSGSARRSRPRGKG
jgi:AcrR family transcriptional regulator